jgi:hypothetical protein
MWVAECERQGLGFRDWGFGKNSEELRVVECGVKKITLEIKGGQ